jgi:hypothetical protein
MSEFPQSPLGRHSPPSSTPHKGKRNVSDRSTRIRRSRIRAHWSRRLHAEDFCGTEGSDGRRRLSRLVALRLSSTYHRAGTYRVPGSCRCTIRAARSNTGRGSARHLSDPSARAHRSDVGRRAGSAQTPGLNLSSSGRLRKQCRRSWCSRRHSFARFGYVDRLFSSLIGDPPTPVFWVYADISTCCSLGSSDRRDLRAGR